MEKESGNESQSDANSAQLNMQNDPIFAIVSNSQLDSLYQNVSLNQSQSESQFQSQSQLTQHNTQSFEHQTDSLVEPNNDNDNDESDNNVRHKVLAEATKRLENAAALLQDPENEGDEYYSTVWSIYTYFNHAHSFLTILNAIHQAAGDVKLAVKRLAHQKDRNDMCDFSYKDIVAPNAVIEHYFAY